MSRGPNSYMGFVGVSTAGSSIRNVFPEWADALGLPTRQLVGHDLPLDASADRYRELVLTIREDPNHWGALVTTHKVAVHSAAADLFDSLDELAETITEISCIAKRGDKLVGSAKDPVTVQLALEEFLPPEHFQRTGGTALILASGGAGTALSHQLAVRGDPPGQIICTARSSATLDYTRAVLDRAGIPEALVRYVVASDPETTGRLVAALPPGSMVVNATGMGKDRPGSPVSDDVTFPDQGLVWEFNYRGSLEFLQQARRQQTARGLHVEDGWRYFLHGWSQAVADVFDVPMQPETVDKLGRIAADVR
jgi:shikimate dehydrogenase